MESEYAGVSLHWAVKTDVGRVRTLNEDSCIAMPPVFAVADGMGGHEAGEIASALTVGRLGEFVGKAPPNVEQIANSLRETHLALQDATVEGESVQMGTTVVGLLLVENSSTVSWLIVNIGDSRAYVLVDGDVHQLTHDHSYVQELVDGGEISASQARIHPERNVITQALGLGEELQPDYWIRPVKALERFLLCSDGLSGELDEREIQELLRSPQLPEDLVDAFVARALERGGHDNVTVIVVDVIEVSGDLAETTGTHPAPAGLEIPEGFNPIEERTLGSKRVDSLGAEERDAVIDEVPIDAVAADKENSGAAQGVELEEVIEAVPESLQAETLEVNEPKTAEESPGLIRSLLSRDGEVENE